MIIVTDDRVGKTVMNPSSGSWIKLMFMILSWMKDSTRQMKTVEKNTNEELMKNGMIVTIKHSPFIQILPKEQYLRKNNANGSIICLNYQK